MSVPSTIASKPVRGCDGCTLCCKLIAVEALEKPRGTWCAHCRQSAGCTIYETRPAECGVFNCGYLYDAALGPEWKPSSSKIVLAFDTAANRLAAHVDPARANAWRQEPFHAALKGWSANALRNGGQVLVVIGQRIIAILPDREVDLGIVDKSKVIVTIAQGGRPDVIAVAPDDPRLASLAGKTSPMRG